MDSKSIVRKGVRVRIPPRAPLEYRHATERDIDAIAGLHADSWRRNYRGAYSDAFLDGPALADRQAVWTDRLTKPQPHQVTVVADEDGVVAFAHAKLDEDPTWGALLDNLHVAQTHQRRGIGARLMSETASAVVERTPSSGLYLWVLEQNTRAQAFYDALGGSCVGREQVVASGGGDLVASLRYAWPDPSTLRGLQ
jgi:ribosomal protein S18 acetylase RimI-like enzyme